MKIEIEVKEYLDDFTDSEIIKGYFNNEDGRLYKVIYNTALDTQYLRPTMTDKNWAEYCKLWKE